MKVVLTIQDKEDDMVNIVIEFDPPLKKGVNDDTVACQLDSICLNAINDAKQKFGQQRPKGKRF